MKKALLFLLFTFSCYSQSSAVDEYKEYLLKLDSTRFYSINVAFLKYRELFKDASTEVCDKAFVAFDEFFLNVLNELNSSPLPYNILIDNKCSTDTNEILANYKKELNACGILVTNDDEMRSREIVTYLKKDYAFVFNNFSGFISNAMVSYQLKLLSYNGEGIVDDGVLLVSPIRLAEYIIDLEKFIKVNPDFVLIDKCKAYKKWFTTLLFKGEEHTRVLNDKSGIKEDFLNSYFFLLQEYPESEITGLLKPYYTLLKNKQIESANNLLEEYMKKGIIEN